MDQSISHLTFIFLYLKWDNIHLIYLIIPQPKIKLQSINSFRNSMKADSTDSPIYYSMPSTKQFLADKDQKNICFPLCEIA